MALETENRMALPKDVVQKQKKIKMFTFGIYRHLQDGMKKREKKVGISQKVSRRMLNG